jgi:ABC-type sugar transport system substrate-binding protein
MVNLIRFILVTYTVFLMGNAYAENLKVIFLIPDENGPSFWQMVTGNSQAAAKTLGVDLEVIYSANNRFEHKLQIDKIVQRKRKPDYIIFRPFQGTVKKSFTLLDQNKIPFVTLERSFFNVESEEIGEPRQKYKHWIGQIVYDDIAGGKLLKNTLIRKHFKKSPNEVMHITGIGGSHDTLSLNRQSTLEQDMLANKEQPIVINQIFPTLWDPAIVTQRFPQIIQRYPKTNVFWCAGDALALEVFKQLKQKGINNILVGGFDWLPAVLKQIVAGNITASVGGHFLMAASALVKIVDYHQGVDRFILPPMIYNYEVITEENVREYIKFMDSKAWNKVDFSLFLHTKSSSVPPELNVKNMIKQLAN